MIEKDTATSFSLILNSVRIRIDLFARIRYFIYRTIIDTNKISS